MYKYLSDIVVVRLNVRDREFENKKMVMTFMKLLTNAILITYSCLAF